MANIKHPNQPSEEELNSFLSKVDELDDVLKGLNSDDPDKQTKYSAKADELIEKYEGEKNKQNKVDDEDPDFPKTSFGFSKTSINKEAYKNESPANNVSVPPAQPDNVDQKAFMAYMEADAKERYERKKAAEKVASGLKEQGNTAFRQGNYQDALEFYDKAIQEVRDSSVLYTNRAQAKIKLGMFKEAISDCDWALRAWPNCLKAYVHQGHAHLGMQEWQEARDSYKSILSLDASKQVIVKDYLAEVDRQEKAAKDETEAVRLFEEGNEAAQGIVDLLTRVHKSDQLPLFYAGGFRVITNLLLDLNSQTLFRTHGGLKLPETHTMVNRYLSASTASLSREERDVLSAALDMLTAGCRNNETSQQQLLALPGFSSQLMSLLEVNVKGQGRQLRSSCLTLLYEISLMDAGRTALVNCTDLERLIKALFPLMMKKSSSYASTAAALLNNVALEKRSKVLLRDKIEISILPEFEKLLKSNQTSPNITCTACSTATNLAADMNIRNKMAARTSLWNVLTHLLASCNESHWKDTVFNILGFLVNISTGVDSSYIKSLDLEVTKALYGVLQKIPPHSSTSLSASTHDNSNNSTATTEGDATQEGNVAEPPVEASGKVGLACQAGEINVRSLVVLSNILPLNQEAAKFMSDDEQARKLLEFTKSEVSSLYKPAVKCLTALTQLSHNVRCLVVSNKGLSTLLTRLTDSDEAVAGNAALCLSHLTKNDGDGDNSGSNQPLGTQVCSKLAKTNIVQKLLTLARDGRKSDLQANCAILLGKLAQGDPRHLERLRELHGLQILHECMKHVKQ